MAQLYGVDVSEFQGQIDWDALNAVANFVIIRASFGTQRKDNQFDRNKSEARRVQAFSGPLGIGYYYFAYPELVDAQTSANYFVDNLGDLQSGEVLALDLEGQIGSDPVGWSLAFLQQVESRTGRKPLLYINQAIMHGYDWSRVINNGNGLWLADYDGNKTGPGVDTPWPVTAVRQWTDADVVNGISGHVDGDVFYGDFDAWNRYGGETSAAPAASLQPQPAPEPAPEPEPSAVVAPATQEAPTPTPIPTVMPQPTTNTGKTPVNVHPKVQAAFVGGIISSALLAALAAAGVRLPEGTSDVITTVVATICGYFVSA